MALMDQQWCLLHREFGMFNLSLDDLDNVLLKHLRQT